MTYLNELSNESIKQKYLAVLTPRRKVSTWSLVSGFIYKASFNSTTYGKPVTFEFNGVEMTEVFTPTVGASEWYFDETNNEIYFRAPQSGDPDIEGVSIVFYNIYCSTFDAYWYLDPLDDTTDIVYFEPIIQKEPDIKSSTVDNIFGFLPIQTSSITLINAESFLEIHVYDSSFSSGRIKVYHALGDELDIANIKLVYDGLMSNVSYDTGKVTIKTIDRVDQFSEEWRNADTSFFNATDFPNLNPTFIGKPIRYVYGYVKGFVPVNIDFKQDSPTTSDNRDWVVIGEQTGLAEISRTVSASPSSTTTRTYISFAEGIMVGDSVWLDGATDYHVIVTAVNFTGDNYIEHAAIAAPMASGEFVKKGFISRVEIIQNNTVYTAMYNRDYTIGDFAVGTRGFSFNTGLEANTGMPATLTTNDIVSCTVYGRVNDLVANMVTFGENDQQGTERTFNLANAVMIIYDMMKNKLGIPESDIDITQFTTLFNSTKSSQSLGIAIPELATNNFPSFKTLIAGILQSCLFRIFLNTSNKWTIEQIAPLSTSSVSIDDYELVGFSYDFDYSDVISDVKVEYQKREIADQSGFAGTQLKTALSTSDTARYLHKIEKQKTFPSLHFKEADAELLADRLGFILGQRQGTIKFRANKRLFENIINDTITVSREKLPGYTYVKETERSRDFAVSQTTKNLKGIEIVADDQLGIQDNEGDW